MMMPTPPSANLVVGKTGFALAALDALLDPVFPSVPTYMRQQPPDLLE
jgi:hypothetical protein